MEEPSHVRAVSLVLALAVVAGGWLLFEFSNRQVEQTARPFESKQTTAAPVPQQPPPLTPQADRRPSPTVPSNLTFKCDQGGRISYGDRPCGPNMATIAVTASEQQPPAQNNLRQLQQRLATMEASRMEREKATASRTIVANSTPPSGVYDSKASLCRTIDQAIAIKDSELRQPHSAQRGDDLTSERKRLTDQRFTLGC